VTDTPRVSFYVLEAEEPAARLGYACRLTEKVFKLGQRIHALAPDTATAQAFDNLLWTFRQGSFVPHVLLAAGSAMEAPVTIGIESQPGPAADLLINLGPAVPADFQRYPRIAEIVAGSESDRAAGRARHQEYRSHGIEPETLRVN
jgi:DNA polymerase III subunit chi